MGRRLLAQHGTGWLNRSARQLHDTTGLKIEYVAMGKAQKEWQCALRDFAIGVFTDPVNAEPIDYRSL